WGPQGSGWSGRPSTSSNAATANTPSSPSAPAARWSPVPSSKGPDTVQLTGFEGKVAVVTGAGRMRSIGRETALALARAGCDVVVTGTGRTPDRYTGEERAAGWRDIDSVAGEIRELGRRAGAVVCDIADDQAVDALVQQVLDDY